MFWDMARELVTRERLKEILDEKIKDVRRDDLCKFYEPNKLIDSDSDGCNWSYPCVSFGGSRISGGPTAEEHHEVIEVVDSVRKEYNVKW